MNFQRTIKRPVSVVGVGLHSGKEAVLTIKPGRPNQGIVFIRTDLRDASPIPAHYKNVTSTQLATTIGYDNIKISTVEHVLAALAGMSIDNAVLEDNGPEVPIMDGSSAAFCEAILKAGLETQSEPRAFVALRRRVEVKVAEKWAVAEPSAQFEIYASIDWDHPAIGYQEYHYEAGRTPFSELARARTFGFLKDVEALKNIGLVKGGSLENAIVLDNAQVLNPDGLRYVDEFVRHKVLDAIGDFKLAGIPIQGYFRIHRAGHELHSHLIAEIFSDPNNYEVIDTAAEELTPSRVMPLALARGVAAAY